MKADLSVVCGATRGAGTGAAAIGDRHRLARRRARDGAAGQPGVGAEAAEGRELRAASAAGGAWAHQLGKADRVLHRGFRELEIEEMVHAVQGPADGDAILQLDDHLLSHEGLEKGVKQLRGQAGSAREQKPCARAAFGSAAPRSAGTRARLTMAPALARGPSVCLASQGGPLAAQHRSGTRRLALAGNFSAAGRASRGKVVPLRPENARWQGRAPGCKRLAATARQ